MIKVVLLATVTLLIFVTQAQARTGTKVGDGGDAVWCPNEKLELLDLYEAEHAYGYSLRIGSIAMSVDVEISAIESRARSILPPDHPFLTELTRAHLLLAVMNVVETSVGLPNGAVETRGVPLSCSVEPIAVLDSYGQLDVRNEFWQTANARVRALTLVHEALHDWFLDADSSWLEGTEPLRQAIGILAASDEIFAAKSALFIRLINSHEALMPNEMAWTHLK